MTDVSSLDATDPDVAAALAVRATTRAAAVGGGTALVIGAIGLGTASMAQVERDGAAASAVIPGLAVLMVGQFVALVATGLAIWALVRLLRRQVPQPAHAVAGLSRGLGVLARGLVAALVVAVTVSVIVAPDAWFAAVLGALVALQVGVVIGLVRRHILTPGASAALPPARRSPGR